MEDCRKKYFTNRTTEIYQIDNLNKWIYITR